MKTVIMSDYRIENQSLFQTICLSIVLFACALSANAQSPMVEVTPLTGNAVRGELRELTADSLSLFVEGETKDYERNGVLTIKIADREETIKSEESLHEVSLVDGSQMNARKITYDGTQFSILTTNLGKLEGKGSLLHHVRYAEGDTTTLSLWKEILARDSKQDLLVINKEESIDFVEGVISKLDEKAVYFLLDGEEIPVGINKVFGIVLSRKPGPSNAIGKLLMANDDQYALSSLSISDGQISAVSESGLRLSTGLDNIEMIDFRQGRLVYLSDLEPRTHDYTPFFDEEWKMRVDQNFDGNPLRIGSQTFKRGLCIHSKTLLKYRLGGQYRRFQAVMGIEELVGNKGHTHVLIKADEDVLFEGDVTGSDEPISLDFDVSERRDLEILVDFGADLAVADHLALGDARLIK